MSVVVRQLGLYTKDTGDAFECIGIITGKRRGATAGQSKARAEASRGLGTARAGCCEALEVGHLRSQSSCIRRRRSPASSKVTFLLSFDNGELSNHAGYTLCGGRAGCDRPRRAGQQGASEAGPLTAAAGDSDGCDRAVTVT
ncbi:hypothetical protein PsYK624_151580 [Phanerochaete sordida]|uniref:Uncharacterized protein n=1 Tax=Phanerochaete sordida TaxID=48140 RepID=A0A9P3LKV7_9APHY|nr:hypothetical protein PsYK624_151580 [Phanerochaete sordida]